MSDRLPLAIEIEINSECNLSCAYCPNSKASRLEKGHMKVETFETLMKQLQQVDYSGRISFHFYNEPTLSPNLNLFVSMTKKYLPRAKSVLYSNGTKLNKESMEQLYSDGLDRFFITEHHQVTLDNLSFASQDLSIENTEKFKYSSYKELPLTNRGGAVKAGKRIEGTLTTPCFIPQCVMVVSLLGNVIACYEDYFQKHVMGNIHEQDIMTIWKSEKYSSFRKDLKAGLRAKHEVCKTCNNQMVIV